MFLLLYRIKEAKDSFGLFYSDFSLTLSPQPAGKNSRLFTFRHAKWQRTNLHIYRVLFVSGPGLVFFFTHQQLMGDVTNIMPIAFVLRYGLELILGWVQHGMDVNLLTHLLALILVHSGRMSTFRNI